MTMVEVAKKYGVSVNNICRWRKRCDRRSGAGRKVTDMEMENNLLLWLTKQNAPIPRKEVQLMAKKMSRSQGFKASKGWF
jgi:transposase-like protein